MTIRRPKPAIGYKKSNGRRGDIQGQPPDVGKLGQEGGAARQRVDPAATYSRIFESMTKVTGPSLTSVISIFAAKRPVTTGRPSAALAKRLKLS